MIEDAPLPTSPDDQSLPPPRSGFGRLAVIFLGIVAAGLLGIAAFGDQGHDHADDDHNDSAVNVTDPGSVPRGALARQSAPNVSIAMLDGTTFSIAEHFELDGRPLVMNLWASWCIPCREEMPAFDELAMANPDIAFVGFAVDDQRKASEEFAAEIGVSYPLGVDEGREIAALYPFVGLPTTYLIDADGIISRQIQGQVTKEQLNAYLDFDLR